MSNLWPDEHLRDAVHRGDEPLASLAADLLTTRAALAKAERILRREPVLDDFKIEQGGVSVGIEGWASTMLARSFLAGLGTAPNYTVKSYTFDHAKGEREHLEVTIQRVGKRSPHTARLEAEAEVHRLRELLAQHGIPVTGPSTFPPDAPPPIDLEGTPRPSGGIATKTPWVRIVPGDPDTYVCTRCGRSQVALSSVETSVALATMEAFRAAHAHCECGDTTVGTPLSR